MAAMMSVAALRRSPEIDRVLPSIRRARLVFLTRARVRAPAGESAGAAACAHARARDPKLMTMA
jgi:hypothetical protein